MTRIRLIDEVNDYLELSEEVIVPINFGVSDVRDLTSKTGSFSKSIRVAGTKHNNQVFNYLFDVNATTLTYNINKKQPCIIEQDGNIILDNAILQLIDVEKVSKGGGNDEQIFYTVTVKDTVGELFTEIGNKLLKDIDFGDLNHTYNATNVIASFDHDVTDGYKYILPAGDDNNYSLVEFKPAIYFDLYLTRIFADAGYTFTWDELEDVGFDKLLLPYNGGKVLVDDETLEASQVIATDATTQDITSMYISNAFTTTPFTPTLIDVATEVDDPNNYYDPSTSTYDCPFDFQAPNKLNYEITIEHEFILDNFTGGQIALNSAQAQIGGLNQLCVQDANDVTKGIINLYFDTVDSRCEINSEGKVLAKYAPTGQFNNGETVMASGTNSLVLACTPVQLNDLLQLKGTILLSNQTGEFRTYPGNVFTDDYRFIFRITDISVRIVPSAEAIGFNFPVVMNNYVPAQIKQSDFVKSVFTMFNLFSYPNPDNNKNIILKTRDLYYDEGDVKDWSAKLAKDKPHVISFLPELTAKKITLSYANDSDEFNKGYLENVNETYGQLEYTFDNEYIKNTERKELIFGASPFVRTSFGAVVMAINGSEPKTLPRVVYDGGKLPCGVYNIYNHANSAQSVDEYPFTSHFNNPINPTLDFNFGICDFYFDIAYNEVTNNNLGNLYWRRSMSQINSGKLYTVYLWLTSYDIQNLKLNDKIYLDRAYWNINKVIDYNANARQLTKVELISVDDEIDLPPFDDRVPFTPIDVDIVISNPFNIFNKKRYESLASNSARGGVVNIGKNNVIAGNVKNAIVIGDNQVITRDGFYIDGRNVLSAGKSITNIDANYQVLETDDIVNVTANSITITLSDSDGSSGRVHHIKNSGSGTITVQGYLGQKIDTLSSFSMIPFEKMTVSSNDGSWIVIA